MSEPTIQTAPIEWRDRDWGLFYREFAPFVMRTLRRWVSDDEAVHDLLQMTFAVAFKKKHELAYPDGTKTWLYRAARYLVLDHYRADGRYKERYVLSEESHAGFKTSSDASIDKRLVLQGLIRQALDRLNDEYREAVLLIDLEGLSTTEAAEMAHVKPDAMRARISRGRKAFQKAFEELKEDALKDLSGNDTIAEEPA